MNVTACLVTRGDVDMQPILDSLPSEWEKVIWINGCGVYIVPANHNGQYEFIPSSEPPADLFVYGRYAAIEYATHDLIYTQDDDVIVSDPQKIVDALVLNVKERSGGRDDWPEFWNHVVCNMPQEFRPHYPDAALVGFGACFHRDAPKRAFERFYASRNDVSYFPDDDLKEFNRECDRVFTVLTPRVLVDIPKTDREFASDPDRLWRQHDHHASTQRMLELARKVRDA